MNAKIQLKIITKLDDESHFHFSDKGDIIIEIPSDREKIISQYGKKQLEFYYSKPQTTRLVITDKKRYIIVDDKNELLFFPLFNKYKNIVDYAISEKNNYELLEKYCFHRLLGTNGKKYVQSSTSVSMHEIVFGKKAELGYKIDHINSNGLDNRKSNLREITNQHNSANRKIKENRYQGVHLNKKTHKWEASLGYNNKNKFSGQFDSLQEALKVRDIYAVYYYSDEKGNIIKPLNSFEGKNILSEQDIKNIHKNGIPEKYQLKNAKKDVSNIKQTENNTYCLMKTISKIFFRLNEAEKFLKNIKSLFPGIDSIQNSSIKEKNKRYIVKLTISKTFKTLEKATSILDTFLEKVETLSKDIVTANISEYRNEDGVATIPVSENKEKLITALVDDEDWMEFIHYNWYIDSGYPRALVNKKNEMMHVLVYKRKDKNYKKYNGNNPIDHIDLNKTNAQKSNLRLATGSLQSQNKIVRKNSIINYIGVRLKVGFFVASTSFGGKSIKGKHHKFIEDAAQEYNDIVLKIHPDARINKIPDTKTTFYDLFHKSKLTLKYIQNIESIGEIQGIFFVNRDWKIKSKLQFIHKLKKSDIYQYIEILSERYSEEFL